MERSWGFKYSLPENPGGQCVELSFAEIESLLLKRLREAEAGGGDMRDALWQLARLCSHAKQHEPALDYLRQVLALQPDAEEKAAMGLAEAIVAIQDENELVAQAAERGAAE